MVIKNANVFMENKVFEKKDILIENEIISRVEDHIPGNDEVIDAGDCYAIPGLIDLHFHGCMGYDICDGTIKAWEEIAKYEASIGVTAMAPATMTLPVEELYRILKVAAEFKKKDSPGADLVGINMEGPFISKVKKGAQDEKNIITCSKEIGERFLCVSGGLVKFLAVAPEENENYEEFIRDMKDKVDISLAHTNADYDTAKKAFDAGANHAVHMFNAMPAFTHRDPGVVGAVFDSEHVMPELICDGVHIHGSMVRAAIKMMGEDRMIFISDSMRAAGLDDGRYTLGGLDVDVKGNRATLVLDGALAGSVTNLMDCMRTAVQCMDIPLETAVACATINPAKSLKIDDQYGSISSGKRGNVVLLDKDLQLKMVIKDGKIIKKS